MENEIMTFRKNALLANLCKEWDTMWRACNNDKEKLVRLALMQQSTPYLITFCNDGRGLSKDYIVNVFGDEINGKQHLNCDDTQGDYLYGLHITDENVNLVDDVATFMWCDDIQVNLRKTKCPILYIGCNSTIRLSCEGYNSCFVYMFDTSKLYVDFLDEKSDITVYKYSRDCYVIRDNNCFGRVSEHQKKLRL